MANGPTTYKNDIEFIRESIGKYFPTYKTEVEFDIVSVYVRVFEGEDVGDRFDGLRKELVPQNYIPHLVKEEGEYIVKVKKTEEKDHRGIKANLAMLLITLTTSLVAGIWWWANYDPAGHSFLSLHNLSHGALYFSLPLLSILGIHEMGHYLMARRHGIKASLPFFLPMAPPLGTMGAFISIREPIPDNRSLLDVGITGPICGFIVAIPVSIIGLYLGATANPSVPTPVEGTQWIWHFPVILRGISGVLPWSGGQTIHPTLFAGWVGFLVTGLNLLPASQLDGGHVFRSLFGENAKYVSYLAFGTLIVIGIWKYFGWLIFAFIILFLGGIKHPPLLNDITNLDKKRLAVGGIGIMILVVSFHPVPVAQQGFSYDFNLDLEEPADQQIILNESANYTFTVKNTFKNVDVEGDDYNISYSVTNHSWNYTFLRKNITFEDNTTGEESSEIKNISWEPIEGNETTVSLDKGENQSYRLKVSPEEGCSNITNIEFKVSSDLPDDGQTKVKELQVELDAGFEADLIGNPYSLIENNETDFDFRLLNKGKNDTYDIRVVDISDENWSVDFLYRNKSKEDNISFTVPYGERINFTARLHLNGSESSSQTTKALTIVKLKVRVKSRNTGQTESFPLIGIRVNE